MFFKLLACNVFFREICLRAAQAPHVYDLEFTEKGEHDRPETLRELLQDKINAAEASSKTYDAILLAYGLCGNALSGLSARKTRLVAPRAHDCCTLFLGSKERFRTHFADNPSRPFSSSGYMERGGGAAHTQGASACLGLDKSYAQYAALYGEENARYIMESLAPPGEAAGEKEVFFIDMPETAFLGYAEKCRKEAEEAGKTFTCVEGDSRLLCGLLLGVWPEEEFLVLAPGEKVRPVYDWDEVIRAG
ncbi:MAG: DUF1638 domain-containing protein [Spirochaetales bacterium]|jgi:hypothetical protein|nr:DUF1638 domain-containing protein [Spirochaetales bacterium]